ncbi:TetR/AcrR family transcriptional regulator C-terminal domain-containing protein [Umezawaea endophytica]|uniref:TetR/AcrR family transcriptional regulator C-terminal domain-containing protein n=1 Tax=Umezawaea endophytica TaxID=1654476 RepID=A0A9X2VL12_9PSEU|nr:TetR/AcrR family transcriptional regulator C-terminal domain-containing protein [Umezawaea endophytica]MCS7478596.1 TetR/AcrR family transcriptional regulator C-terminal domain-containing protein [Umezawaea endophytica]
MRDDSDGNELVWDRPEPPTRPAPTALSRSRIVAAAIGLADADGMDAVSLRKVAAALDAGPMRLYGYVASKDELLDLMVDEVYGELPPPSEPSGEDWRAALRSIAHRLRDAAHRHEWFIDLLGGRPHVRGPNALAFLEESLAALDRTADFTDVADVMRAVRTFTAYVTGAIRAEVGEARAERATGLALAQWQRASVPYLRRMLATGRYPTVEKVITHDGEEPDADTTFEAGLGAVLDGIAHAFAR